MTAPPSRTRRIRWLALGSAIALSAGIAMAGLATPAGAADTTSKLERTRVDSVATPKLDWYACEFGEFGECATAKVPLDYDFPKGQQVELAVVRHKATDQKHRIGSLFFNPGGPGVSAADYIAYADYWLGESVLERFDVVGFDPRGVGYSDNVRCFPSPREQYSALEPTGDLWFPVTAKEDKAHIAASKKLGNACSGPGQPLAGSMSTAQVARDMDVLRRAVGDKSLSYFGMSYGTYLGEVYANMFPDRIRAMTLDGIIDPVAWAGTPATKNSYIFDREKSAEGAYKALIEILKRCDNAGGERCEFAPGNPVDNFDLVAQRLKQKPLVDVDPDTGEELAFGYDDLIGNVLGVLYYTDGAEIIAYNLAQLIILTEPPATGAKVKAQSAKKAAALEKLSASLKRTEQANKRIIPFGFPYDNGLESYLSVMCSDGLAPASADAWPSYAATADARVKYFGRDLAAAGVPCSTDTWTAQDEDAYRGPFDKSTSATVLIVGDVYDPITNYDNAVRLDKLMPKSRLVSSDSWGHTAYGTSACVTSTVDKYLVKITVPSKTKRCTGDDQPFSGDDFSEESVTGSALARATAMIARRGGGIR